ncbi:dTDP-4-amino-4,6-dideoxygalactose transaminase [Sphingomonas naphthae]|uniref:dTDP-4-amino-4,6-dideoxygalactose transaminase n=1 Tax=Sphingomonas naphthae TaxID=1813468 RepID=A0ABY7TQE8_9SPHN|nr:dTDP-4-amino-4,6-dideoxygalactose transaminase [Sphingomonas naphthae]WCT74590.1 dTDP-4-amino-4,6-dideoxygalactose transaminase [Sphingomonas naphthae]
MNAPYQSRDTGCQGNPPPIPFNRVSLSPAVRREVMRALDDGSLTGGGRNTRRCHEKLDAIYSGSRPFLTNSCTAALEMAALLLGVGPGDEIILPSWTFSSTATAVALRGAVPVFVDVLPTTLNIDVARVEEAITPRTRAVYAVHYAGVACAMDALVALCADRGIALVEDAAQAFGSSWDGKPLGGFGDFGALSFHGTKNVSCGEGGALIVNRPDAAAAAEIAWEKGTDRLRFEQGHVSSYEWQALGSSFLPSDLTAALLAAQFDDADAKRAARLAAYDRYVALLADCAARGRVRLLAIPEQAAGNGHIFALRFENEARRAGVIARLAYERIDARTHYKPLHSSPGGRRYGRVAGPMGVTDEAAATLLRLPLDDVITPVEQERIVAVIEAALRH